MLHSNYDSKLFKENFNTPSEEIIGELVVDLFCFDQDF